MTSYYKYGVFDYSVSYENPVPFFRGYFKVTDSVVTGFYSFNYNVEPSFFESVFVNSGVYVSSNDNKYPIMDGFGIVFFSESLRDYFNTANTLTLTDALTDAHFSLRSNNTGGYSLFNPSNSFGGWFELSVMNIFYGVSVDQPTNDDLILYASITRSETNTVCFKEDTKILTDKGYVSIQELRKGDLVKTACNDYVPINMIGTKQINHTSEQERIKDQLYICTSKNYPEIFEDLVITGCHSILVDQFKNEEQKEMTRNFFNDIFITDNKYRLPACLDERTIVYERPGVYNIYHIALDNDNYYYNYGIYANGLLVESCSKRYMKELSNMRLIE